MGWLRTKTPVQFKLGLGEDVSEEFKGVLAVQVGGLLQGHQDIVVVGAGFGAEAAGELAEDHAGTDQTFSEIVVGTDPVGIVQEGAELMRMFGEAFAEAPDVT